MYKSFTPEKSLLDWIFLASSSRACTMPLPLEINIAALNLPNLFGLADRLNIRELLDSYLLKVYAFGCVYK